MKAILFSTYSIRRNTKEIVCISITTSNNTITCAALSDASKGDYTTHLVNKGATRTVNITGFPSKVKSVKVY